MSTFVALEANVKPGMQGELIQLLKQYLPETRQYDGFINISIHLEQGRDRVLFYSEWQTREHYDAYLQWRAETGVMEILSEKFSSVPTIRYFQPDCCSVELSV